MTAMLSGQVDRIATELEAYGLGEEAIIYAHLLGLGPSTALALSRETGIARTKVYRLLDKLEEQKLVKPDPREPERFRPAPYQELERQLVLQEQRLASLRASMPSLFGDLASLVASRASGSKLTFYDSAEGLVEITRHSTSAQGELRIFEKAHDMTDFMSYKEAEVIRQDFSNNDVQILQISNLKKLKAFSDVAKHVADTHSRYIDPSMLPIKFEQVIYNNTVALYNHGEETFGIEIESAPFAAMQRQLFDMVWGVAAPMKRIGKRGAAEVVKK